MAGSRKIISLSILLNIFLFFSELPVCIHSLQCKSQQNEAVDWFIAYKIPSSIQGYSKNSFFYMDARSKTWSLSDKTLNDDGQAVYYTLDQIYKKSENVDDSVEDFMYLMYNDEPSKNIEETKLRYKSVEHGHTKGVIGFDSQSGFWLIHSTPQFPPIKAHGYSYPSTADYHGQSFLCISMATSPYADEVGRQLLYNYPKIYDYEFPDDLGSKIPNMSAAINGKHVTQEPWYRQTSLMSLSGTKFLSFAKFAYFDNDLYSEWLAPEFRDNLLVETWQNGPKKMCSNCSGMYKVYNVNSTEFASYQITFKETQDHSKWMVTNTSRDAWTCIGDINRQVPQKRRSGGTVCFQDYSVWKNFRQIVSSYHDCSPYANCIPP